MSPVILSTFHKIPPFSAPSWLRVRACDRIANAIEGATQRILAGRRVTNPRKGAFFFLRNCSKLTMSEQLRVSYEFEPFFLDAVKRRLLRDGEPVTLSPKILETLLVLIDNRHRVVTKEELLKQLWGDTIVEEGGLTRNISILRKTLGEKPDDHLYVVTLPARGYQFVAAVREVRETRRGSARAGSGASARSPPRHVAPPQSVAGWLLSHWRSSFWGERSRMLCARSEPPNPRSPHLPCSHWRIFRAIPRRSTSPTE